MPSSNKRLKSSRQHRAVISRKSARHVRRKSKTKSKRSRMSTYRGDFLGRLTEGARVASVLPSPSFIDSQPKHRLGRTNWFSPDVAFNRVQLRVLCNDQFLNPEDIEMLKQLYSLNNGTINSEESTSICKLIAERLNESGIQRTKKPFLGLDPIDGDDLSRPRFGNGTGFSSWHLDGDHDGVTAQQSRDDLAYIIVIYLEAAGHCWSTRANVDGVKRKRTHYYANPTSNPVPTSEDTIHNCFVPSAGSVVVHASTVAHRSPSENCGLRLVIDFEPDV